MFGKFGKYHPDAIRLNASRFDLVLALRQDFEFVCAQDRGAHAMQFCSGPASWILTSDRERIRYIAVNLLQNACKYSPPASVIRVELRADDRAACLRVSDEGIGIPAAEIAELFSPFYRASNAGDRPGTGMGLAVVKESAQVVGAKIGIDSRAGQGTTFTVTLARTPER